MNENLYALLESHFPSDRQKPVMRLADGRVISYAEMTQQVGRYAALFDRLELRPGDRVAVQVDKSPEAVFVYLACLQTGAVYLPLNVAYTASEIDYFLGDAEPRLLVCRPAALETLTPLARARGVTHILDLDAEDGGGLSEAARSLTPRRTITPRAGDDLAAICYTSGTTGRSKGAMISHGNLAANAQTLKQIWHFKPGDVLLHALPIFHVHGLFVAINTTLLTGSSMIFLPKFDLEAVIRLLPQATVMMGVPTFYVRLLSHPEFTAELVADMRLFIAGSAPLLSETFGRFEARTGQRILERYGMTEAGMITSNPYDGERRAGTVGFALPDVEVRICDGEGRRLADGEIGVLEAKGPNVFKGYWRMPEKTACEFRADGFFITGDMARIDADGYIHIVGRDKDLIISGGFNVYPKEIELVIDALPEVIESAVIGLPHPDFGEAVTAVVKRDGDVSEPQIIAAVKDHLANFKVPKRVYFVDELPRNAMGKVQKAELRLRYKDSFAAAT